MNRQTVETLGAVGMNLPPKRRHALGRYGLAMAFAIVALLIRSALPVPEGTAIYQLPIVAVVLSGWYGGRGPALVASAICATGILYRFIPPAHTFEMTPDYALGFFIFIALCLLLSEFSAGRRHAEQELRASEARFRALVQFSFDVYWETDAQHRFTRQEFSERLTDAPAPGSEIGKTRWEIPYVEPDEEAWRKHRATMDAHLPFRDFELARRTADGGIRYVSVSGIPVFDETGRFAGYRGVGRHITDRKRAEAEHRAHMWFLESMDRINRAMQGTNDLERMMGDVLDAVLEIFASDRAWILYPCDPNAPSWRAVMERIRPEFPGTRGRDLPLTVDSAEIARAALDSEGALLAGPGHGRQVEPELAEHFGVRSKMLMALRPKGDRPYLFGLHQCSRPRTWTKDEQRLFEEIGHRVTDGLASLIAFRSLQESERKLEAAQRIAHVGWWERDFVTGRVSLSDEACSIFGVQPLDLPHWQDRWLNLIHPEDREKTAAASETALRGGPRYDVEYRIVRPDGTVRVVHSQGDVTGDESGRPLRQFGVMQDITELRRAEGELRASEARFRTFVDRATDAFFLLDDKARVVDVNRQACESLGFTREELIGMHPRDFDVALDEASIERLVGRARAGETITFETRHRRKDGTTFPVEIRASMFPKDGKLLNLALVRDITERKLAEESLRQSEAYLTEAQRLSHTGSWALDVATNRYLYTSVEFDRIFGFDAQGEAPTRDAVMKRMHPDDRISWTRILEKSVREKLDTTSEYRILLADGSVRHIRTIRHPVVNSAGEVVKLVGTSIDITERKLAEESLRQSEAYLTEAQRLSHTGSWALDLTSNRYVYTSEESDRIFGFDPRGEKPSREAVSQRIHPEDRSNWKRNLEKSLRENVDTFDEYRIVLPDGDVRHIHTIRHPVMNSAGQVVKLVGTSIDVTERKRAEQERERLLRLEAELAHANRVNTLGELTASIAHEVNQPLGAMVTSAAACARWLTAEPPNMEEARSVLEHIVADGKRAGEIIGRVRALTKRQMPRMELLDINVKVRQVVELADDELRSRDVVLRTELDAMLPGVYGDRVQLQQVVLNLVMNAIEAMAGVVGRPRELTIVTTRSSASEVVVEVRDSGPGVAQDRVERIFESFYTTKPEGIGIGLSISRSIVEAHGGRLWASSNQPHGAVFRLSLPIAQESTA